MELNLLPPSDAVEQIYVFASAYGGAVKSSKPPQIHDLMTKLRKEVGAVKAVKQAGGPLFPVRGAKDLNQKLADALNTLNMAAPVVAQEVVLIEADKIPKNENSKGNPVFRTLAHVKATVRLIAPDTSFVDVVGSGHGGDVDDKSGGKASTYAWKDAILKGLSIPHEDMVDTDDDSSTGDGEAKAVRGAGRAAAAGGSARKMARGEADSAGSGGAGEVGQAGRGAGNVVGEVDNGAAGAAPRDSVGGDLAATLAKIERATTTVELEQIREEIKSGSLNLHGADKLKATQAWVLKKKDVK